MRERERGKEGDMMGALLLLPEMLISSLLLLMLCVHTCSILMLIHSKEVGRREEKMHNGHDNEQRLSYAAPWHKYTSSNIMLL